MKKSTKRILCGALSVALAGTLAIEHSLEMSAEQQAYSSVASASFKDVTGEFDTTALREQNFNSQVLTADTTPTYETRSVIVELDGEPLSERAENDAVSSYVRSWAGQRAAENIRSEQETFLRRLSKAGVSYEVERYYDTVLNAVAIEVNTKHVSQIKRMAGVNSVVIATTYAEPQAITTSATSDDGVVTNQTSVYATGIYDSTAYVTGENSYDEGTVVAILDTGLDYTHSAFARQPENPAWSESYVETLMKDNLLEAEERTGGLNVNDVYVSSKVPFAYDYADDDADVYPSYSNHGTHVAGIIGGYDESGYTDKDGNAINETFRGVLPDSQLVICKVFTDDLDDEDLGGAVATDIIAALEDCVTLGVDVINMSLGTSCGFTTTDDGDEEGELLNAVYERIKNSGVSLVCAASNDYSSAYGGVFGTNLISNPDSGTVGSPSTFASALSVASISGQKSPYMTAKDAAGNDIFAFYEESRDENGNPYDFAEQMLGSEESKEFEYVVIPGTGSSANYTTDTVQKIKGRIALIARGDSTFQEKVEVAMKYKAAAVIVYNNVAGVIRMNLGEIENPCPAVSINMDAGDALKKAAGGYNGVGKITISKSTSAGPFMSDFSSWGPTHDLRLKPEITAHGGEITSTVPGGYGEQSGTSMASPNMAGVMAIIRNYVKSNAALNNGGSITAAEVNRLANQLIMSTATTVYDQTGRPYSPRKQGAGLGSLAKVIDNTSAYLYTNDDYNDNRPKFELGDDAAKTGVYGDEDDKMQFFVRNFGSTPLTFTTEQLVLTETIAKDGLAVAEQAYTLSPKSVSWTVNGSAVTDKMVSVAAGATAEISVVIELSDADKAYLEQFPNGMYVEGFLKLVSADQNAQCDLTLPFLGFYGDWEKATMLDYTAYEIAESEKDVSVEDENKKKATVWATQPYTSYYNEKYILPMGGYVYLLDENDVPMYANEQYNAVSRYNDYYGEDNEENYLTSTAIKAVYAGLLRNARVVKYTLYDQTTGEEVLSSEKNRIGKAYAGGGSAVPANAELELSPEEVGLVSNGTYRVDMEFYMNDPDVYTKIWDGTQTDTLVDYDNAKGTYSFTFTVDYEAPVLEDVRVRYYNYKDGSKEKQKIYLDVDVYDNHYAQALMLCYPTTNAEGEVVLQLATDYPTPIREPNKNGTTTVSIEITDIYEEYGKQLYLQIDDYAINSCLYQLDINEANQASLPNDGFSLVAGEEELTLGLYETHKVALTYTGEADLSNFVWSSDNPLVADVKNGEIVGLGVGEARISVTDRKGNVQKIKVTVTEETEAVLPSVPSISFGVIKGWNEALVKPSASNGYSVTVKAGKEIPLRIQSEPWYHPMTGLTVVWESTAPSVATVDGDGNVKTLKKGLATIKATLYKGTVNTGFAATVALNVEEEFDVSNYTLNGYDGIGYNEGDSAENGVLVIPTDENIMYIGEDAFKDNDNIRRIVIPASVVEIREGAFENCTALEEVYFVSQKYREDGNGKVVNADVDWADLSLVNKRAFYNCPKLKKLDFTNTKTFTVANEAFANCGSLQEVVAMPRIGTMHHFAFANCVSLQSADLTGLHMSGDNVFDNCTGLTTIKTDKFTALGDYMFRGCTGLRSEITVRTSKIGVGAFYDCVNLKGVKFEKGAEGMQFEIGAYAFANCGKGQKVGFTVNFNGEAVRSIGAYAFAGANIKTTTLALPNGLLSLGEGAWTDTAVTNLEIGDTLDLEALTLSGTAFKNVQVTVAEGSTKYADENGVLYALNASGEKTKVLLVNTTVSGALELPATVTEIAEYAFAGSAVTSVKLPATTFVLGEGAFANSALQTIDFNGATVGEIPAFAFCGSKITSVALPESVTTVGEYAFADSALNAFSAAGLKNVGDFAFADCAALQTVALNDSVEKMGDGVFYGATALTEIVLPSVRELGAYTFYGATALKKVTFGANAQTTGTYTFAETAVQEVAFNEGLTAIGEGVFQNDKALTTIVLPSTVTRVDAYAFAGCIQLVNANLEGLRTIEKHAFYNVPFSALNLAAAEFVGDYAFAQVRENGAYGSYTVLTIPAIKTIGNFAFFNGGQAEVLLPLSVEEIGIGAFASAKNMRSFYFYQSETNGNTNGKYFLKDNVLYRYLNDEKTEFELICYPGCLISSGNYSYEILDGTKRIESYAFYGLLRSVVAQIRIPYSVKSIGDAAFLEAGITHYSFECIQAPVLENVYRAEVKEAIELLADERQLAAYYKGLYYANFETLIFDYSEYGSKKSGLYMYYPSNGTGYDNYVYATYFANRTPTGVHMTDDTRACIDGLTTLADATTVASWLQWEVNDGNKATVQAFCDTVKSLRATYNNVMRDEGQKALIDGALTEKLLAVEAALRDVKVKFSIPVRVELVEVAATSAHKATYVAGETFDMTGLVLVVTYDDGSTVEVQAGAPELTLVNTAALTEYNTYVTVEYDNGVQVREAYVMITVSKFVEESSDSTEPPDTSTALGIALMIFGGVLVVLGCGGVVLFTQLKKRKSGKTVDGAEGENVAEEATSEDAPTSEEAPEKEE